MPYDPSRYQVDYSWIARAGQQVGDVIKQVPEVIRASRAISEGKVSNPDIFKGYMKEIEGLKDDEIRRMGYPTRDALIKAVTPGPRMTVPDYSSIALKAFGIPYAKIATERKARGEQQALSGAVQQATSPNAVPQTLAPPAEGPVDPRRGAQSGAFQGSGPQQPDSPLGLPSAQPQTPQPRVSYLGAPSATTPAQIASNPGVAALSPTTNQLEQNPMYASAQEEEKSARRATEQEAIQARHDDRIRTQEESQKIRAASQKAQERVAEFRVAKGNQEMKMDDARFTGDEIQKKKADILALEAGKLNAQKMAVFTGNNDAVEPIDDDLTEAKEQLRELESLYKVLKKEAKLVRKNARPASAPGPDISNQSKRGLGL